MFTTTIRAGVIAPTNATSTTTIGGSRTISYVIDGSDLSSLGTNSNVLEETHDQDTDTAGYWLSASGAVNTNDGVNYWSTTEILTFNLDMAYDVDAVRLWTCWRGGDNPTRAIKTFDMRFSTDKGVTYPLHLTGSTLGDFLIGTE